MWELPGDLVVRIPGFQRHGLGSTPGQGTEIPQAEQCGQKNKNKNPEKQNRVLGLVPRESDLTGMGICILVFVYVCVLYFITLFLAF